ncbi:DUF6125 family protein [Chloroflexota bacterium]
MSELQDYSGDYKPDLNLTDFSKEALIRLVIAAAKLYLGADGMWTTVISKRYGNDVALDCSREVWATNYMHEIRRPCEAMNIEGDDVATAFKHLQIDPAFAVMFDCDFDLKSKNHGVFTVKRCNTLDYCERHNDTWLQKLACEELDTPLFQKTAEYFNPKMKANPLKLPPRKDKDDIACQWEYVIEQV